MHAKQFKGVVSTELPAFYTSKDFSFANVARIEFHFSVVQHSFV